MPASGAVPSGAGGLLAQPSPRARLLPEGLLKLLETLEKNPKFLLVSLSYSLKFLRLPRYLRSQPWALPLASDIQPLSSHGTLDY